MLTPKHDGALPGDSAFEVMLQPSNIRESVKLAIKSGWEQNIWVASDGIITSVAGVPWM